MRRIPATLLLAAPIAAVAALGAGCRPDFAPYNRVTSLRVLAIQSDPPSPFTGETATLSALVFTPTDDPSLTYSWSWCPFPGPAGDGHNCLVTEADIAAAVGGGMQVPSFALGTDPTATLPNLISADLLQPLCDGMAGVSTKIDCTNGFPVQIALTVKTDAPDSADAPNQIDAVSTTHWRFKSDMAPNQNPTIGKLTATVADAPSEILDQPTFALPRDAETALHAEVVQDDASEAYDAPDDNGAVMPFRERLFLTWFVETGDTQYSRTSFIDGRTPFEDLLKNKWSPEKTKDYMKDTARLFVVIHDNRGGVSWKTGTVNLEPTP